MRVVTTAKAINSDSVIFVTYSVWMIVSVPAGRTRTKAPGNPFAEVRPT